MGCRAVTLDHTREGVTHVASTPSREDLENALTEAKSVDANLRRVIDTIPVLAWCNLPDGSNEFHNQRWRVADKKQMRRIVLEEVEPHESGHCRWRSISRL